MPYDVIVVGARVAGSTTAMLLARAGLRVLAVDRAAFPSDTVSSHQVQVPAVARLARWGLLGRLRSAGTPPTRAVRFDAGRIVLAGAFPASGGVDAMFSPRRTLLDTVLADAARSAGAEIRERFRVERLVWRDGRVAGVRGRCGRGPEVTETSQLVVGADGKRSLVAAAVGAVAYREQSVRTFASYGYWSGVPLDGGELYHRPGCAAAAFPTNDDLTMVYVASPLSEFAAARRDLDGHHLRQLDGCGDLGARVRAGVRAERLRTTPDQPNVLRTSFGPGWALVGDAGAVMDSVSAQGIAHALADAESLAHAVVAGLSGSLPLAAALAERHRLRDRTVRPMFDLTLRLAELRSRRVDHLMFAALADRPADAERFFGALSGTVPADRFFTPRTVLPLIGAAGWRRLIG
ncbi:NAD(P)/FAD-dependent oxidoreductase [Jiangella asiatica]|uniref:NAD(P)/FAD-dependent oxidoreductase n=1 Tax=Jiangella asiatica TaxID=2530372 RepID=UPI0013A5CEF1|nr:NAD(P)/FAD-dependent oxidoreductase [Jiangella asiatica]